MLKKTLKIVATIIGVVLLVVVAFYVKVYFSVENRINKKYSVQVQPISLNRDSATLAYGKRLITAKGCDDCHGKDLGGAVVIDDPALGLLVGRNLTRGKGGLPQNFGLTEWTLALKHGLDADSTPLLLMPAQEFSMFSEEDLGAIIAYCSQVPPVDRELPRSRVGPLGRVLTELEKVELIPAELIDHSRKLERFVRAEASPAYGKYLAVTCASCHRENMKGGTPVAPGFPPAADISSSGNPGKWSTDQFIQTLRTGRTPEGKELNPKDMPWTMTKAYTDLELQALHLYLKSK